MPGWSTKSLSSTRLKSPLPAESFFLLSYPRPESGIKMLSDTGCFQVCWLTPQGLCTASGCSPSTYTSSVWLWLGLSCLPYQTLSSCRAGTSSCCSWRHPSPLRPLLCWAGLFQLRGAVSASCQLSDNMSIARKHIWWEYLHYGNWQILQIKPSLSLESRLSKIHQDTTDSRPAFSPHPFNLTHSRWTNVLCNRTKI